MQAKVLRVWAACGFLVLGAAWASGAGTARVDLSKPFEVDKDTIALYHLDDVASGQVKDAVGEGRAGKVVEAAEAEGKFGKALDGDGTKGWVDFASLPRREGLTALTAECWVRFRDRAVADIVCRTGQFMIRVPGKVHAYFWIDGAWRIVEGAKALPVDRWTHLAITWDQATRMAGIYVDGQLDVAQKPEGITDAKLGGGVGGMRLGGHTWKQNPRFLNGLLDEVRISSVARQYQTAAPARQEKPAETAKPPAPAREHFPAVSEKPLKPWATNTDPTDVAKSKAIEITEGTQKYTVVQGGTMDGRSCRSPMGCGMAREGAFYQTWESNRSVRMQNVGETDVINPWLSNGRNNFRTVKEIASSALAPGMTDADRALAIWAQQIQYRHHAPGDNNELGDPVKVFNIYGYNTCGNDSICMATLWKAVGLKAAPARALGHCISQAFHDKAWHFYDGDLHSVYLLRDNQTVASEQDIVRDHDLVKRTHSQGILFPDTWWHGQGMPALYFYVGEVTGQRSGKADTTMNMVLRPGEALVWRWGQVTPLKYHGKLQTMPTYVGVPHTICNGLWEYRPDLTKETWRRGATVENVTSGQQGLTAEKGKTGTIVWTMSSPYVFVGGRIEAEGKGLKFLICHDGKAWRPAGGNLDRFFAIVGPAHYRYQLKCQLEAGAQLSKVAIINDLQMAPMALPEMVVGENVFTYSDQTPGERKVRTTHNWVERSTSKPPPAPPAALNPPDGGESDGTDTVFQWTAPKATDGGRIGDYQFELSRRGDMKLPLSMDFYKLISRTADASVVRDKDGNIANATVKSQYTLPLPGLLTPDQKYHWHVRAMNDKGVWGPWSKTWSFTARGVACPVEVTPDYDEAKGVGTLKWKANPVGKRPAKYRVYGSDEKGFTIGDQRYQSTVGVSKKEMADWNPWFPANFVAETAATELVVMGCDVDLPAANKTYYRVVAVDEQGKRSGASDYAAGPRPIIYSRPVLAAKVGTKYRYQVRANRSLGDLTARMRGNNQVSGYFDIERPRFALKQGPAWLKIDAATGVLSGTPRAAGRAEVAVTATIDREARKLDEKALVWGSEKILSTATERVGVATQKFVLDVR
ncbi:MAG: hypothetical protein ISS72_08195 [Candidatus Brocadiae bacterium]|nr:hypothetical protein [Candidatus Brocadiia bacterium]